MRILVNGASKTVRELLPIYRDELGAMITPFTGNAPTSIAALGIPWVCDNGCFPQAGKRFGFDAAKFVRMLDRVQGLPGLQWVTVPDFVERRDDGNVYGDAAKTRAMFDEWAPEMEARGLPLAYVLQDGVTIAEIPWDRIRAVFVGGSDQYKLGLPAPWLEGQTSVREICAEAKRRGKLVHVGRVNSIKRIRYSYLELVADSVDGTGTSMFPKVKIPLYADAVIDLKGEHPRTPPAAPAVAAQRLPEATIRKFPAGYGIAGRAPLDLMFRARDGAALTPEDVITAQVLGWKAAGLVPRRFPSPEAAVVYALTRGFLVDLPLAEAA